MPKIDIQAISEESGTIYPGALADIVRGRSRRRLGNAGGLTQFGVNLTRLAPGAASAHRHWHQSEDEFVYIISGAVTLVEDDGETALQAGEAAAFPAGNANGHHLVNRSSADVVFLEVGTRQREDAVTYTDPDVDMAVTKTKGAWSVTRKDGSGF